ncbi:MAG: type III pantothenate kinase [bacterium]|nr:type III pantothenate kinase [bacterium]
MLLMAVDIGNTNVVVGLFNQDQIVARWRLSSKAARTEDEYWILLNSLFRNNEIDIGKVRGAIISSVVPDLTMPFVRIAENFLMVEPVLVEPELNLRLQLKVDNPKSVGADRICNCVAGFQKYGGPLVILDFGTATTFDVVTEKFEFIGGIIAPGIEMTAAILHQFAAKLPKVELKFPRTVIGSNTETNIQSGLMFGTVDLINGLLNRIEKQLKKEIKVIATGGLAIIIVPQLDRKIVIEPDLTLLGLKLIYDSID